MTDDERAMTNLVDTWMSATKNGDIETVLNLMADGVIFTARKMASALLGRG